LARLLLCERLVALTVGRTILAAILLLLLSLRSLLSLSFKNIIRLLLLIRLLSQPFSAEQLTSEVDLLLREDQ